MTADDIMTITRLVGGVDMLTKENLARVCLREYREKQELKSRLVSEKRTHRYRSLAKQIAKLEAERDHYRELYQITLKRNEILRPRVAKRRAAA